MWACMVGMGFIRYLARCIISGMVFGERSRVGLANSHGSQPVSKVVFGGFGGWSERECINV